MDFLETDSKYLWTEMKREEKRLVQKRRWLLGLPSSHSKKQSSKCKDPNFFKENPLPESFLREDDPFLDKLKLALNNGHRGSISGDIPNHKIDNLIEPHVDSPHLITLLLSSLDNMTNSCLIDLTSAMVSNPSDYIRTRTKMKKFIRNHLRKILEKYKSGSSDVCDMQKFSKFLEDCNNFKNVRGLYSHRSILECHDAVRNTLSHLKLAPFHILHAMLRRLGVVPHVSKRKRHDLVCEVRKACLDMLVIDSDGKDDGYRLPDLLAMTMEVFSRSMKQVLDSRVDSPLPEKFYHFSPAEEALMDEIGMALHLMQKRMSSTKLKTLKHVLDVNEDVSNRSVRTSVRDRLSDYLFECGDANTEPPDSLIRFLNLINGPYRPHCSTRLNEEEVEYVLSVGADMKQILWDSLLDHDVDQDFADAFMEDLEDSDDGEFECRWVVDDNMGISKPCSSSSDKFMADIVDVKDAKAFEEVNSPHRRIKSEVIESELCGYEVGVHDNTQSVRRNEYLDVQDVCDRVSAATYSLVGCLLDRYGRAEGLYFDESTRLYLKHDILTLGDVKVAEDGPGRNGDGDYVFQVVKTLIPEFPESGLKKIDELMNM